MERSVRLVRGLSESGKAAAVAILRAFREVFQKRSCRESFGAPARGTFRPNFNALQHRRLRDVVRLHVLVDGYVVCEVTVCVCRDTHTLNTGSTKRHVYICAFLLYRNGRDKVVSCLKFAWCGRVWTQHHNLDYLTSPFI